MTLSIENLMQSTFGESSSDIRASFKKTVLIKQYETEVVELETTLKVEEELTGAQRMFISAALQVQLEYTAYCQLLFKGIVTQTEFQTRKKSLEDSLNALKDKAEAVCGESLDKYIKFNLD